MFAGMIIYIILQKFFLVSRKSRSEEVMEEFRFSMRIFVQQNELNQDQLTRNDSFLFIYGVYNASKKHFLQHSSFWYIKFEV